MVLPVVPPEGVRPRHEAKIYFTERARSDAVAAAIFGCIAVAVLASTAVSSLQAGRNTSLFAVGLPFLFIFGGIAAWLAWRFFDRSPLLKITREGLRSPEMKARLRWEDIEDVELDPRGTMRVRVHGANHDRPLLHVKLHRLPAKKRASAFDEVRARVDAARQAAGRDESPTTRALRATAEFDERLNAMTPRTWAVPTIVALNVAAWLPAAAAGVSPLRPDAASLFVVGGSSASAVILHGDYWRLFTAMFLHSGVLHITFNMLGLWQPGRELVRHIGNGQFLFVWVATGLCAGAASLHFSGQTAISVGASGAVFGVLGALVASAWKYRDHLPELKRKQLWSGPAAFTMYALMHGFGNSHVDNAAHVGGLVSGAMLGLLLPTRFDARGAHVAPMQLLLGGALSAFAVVIGVMTTPVPPVWHHELLAASEVLGKVGPDLAELGRSALKFGASTASDAEARALLQRSLVPRCRSAVDQLATVRLPGSDPVAQVASSMSRLCALTIERVELAERSDPEEKKAAARRIGEIDAETKVLAVTLAALRAGGDRAAKGRR